MFSTRAVFSKIRYAVDWWLVAAVVALVAVGLFAVYSASYYYGGMTKYLTVQSAAFVIGVVFMIGIARFNYQYYKQLDKPLYIISIIFLVSVLIFGTTINGAKRWIDLGIFSFQPVEIAKLIYILVLASFLDKNIKSVRKPSVFIGCVLILMGHFALIMLEPAFSSSLSYFLVTLVLIYIAGAETFYLLCIIIFCASSVGIPLGFEYIRFSPEGINTATLFGRYLNYLQTNFAGIFYAAAGAVFILFFTWWFLWKLKTRISIVYPVLLSFAILFGCAASLSVESTLKDYQRKRMVVFLYPESDARGAGYNVIQSKIAMGSGKIAGKGFLKGTQTQLGFLPEQHTDFIFSVIGEEGGWLASQFVILLYFIFIWRALVIAREARDRYGSFVSTGIAAMFTFYAVINIAMVTGLMPVAGVPLLFLSYGGSSMVSSLCAVGILLSIHMRRHTN
ncbi:rod shape-determining protein RodA [Endomicrobium proavitum]|uniref:Cell wall polymerase n=1 Tax=Endomicrobium proavitum TaxID=1408281 RepID=A0A0G3WK73_9BACT|nr:rod shape-determining protein RodA [Endomicrobium proavitum]AKL98703.1 rod shape-determining protein RodA [Endomicrobium proavitum]